MNECNNNGIIIYSSGSGGGFTGNHNDLNGRSDLSTHPAHSIDYDNTTSELTAENVQDAIDELNDSPTTYSGVSSPTTILYTPGNSGQITATQTNAFLHKTAGWDDEIAEYTLAQITPTLTANTYSYIVADYNSGTPILRVTTDPSEINNSNIVLVAHAYWESQVSPAVDEVHFFIVTTNSYGKANKISNRLIQTNRYERSSGLILSEIGTRNISTTSGVIWYGCSSYALDALDTSVSDKIHFYYHVGGVWTVNPNVTQYNNTQYDNGTDLVSTSSNRYVVNWIYRSVNHASFFMVLGGGDYKLNEAEASQPPSLPNIISRQSILVGRIIVLQGASTATVVQIAFGVTFTGSAAQQHNDLTGRSDASTHPATAIDYSNTTSKLSATTVQASIDELSIKLVTVVSQNSHGFAEKNVIYNNAGTWTKAIATTSNTLGIAIVKQSIDTNTFTMISLGMATFTSHGFTTGQYLYLSATSAGTLTATEPIGLTYYSNPIAYVIDSNTLFVFPWRPSNSIPRSNDNFITNITTTPYNVTDIDEVILVDSTSGTITVNLPTPSSTYIGFTVVIKKIVAANTVTIKCASGNIDGTLGSTGINLTTIYDAAKLVCCGTCYWRI